MDVCTSERRKDLKLSLFRKHYQSRIFPAFMIAVLCTAIIITLLSVSPAQSVLAQQTTQEKEGWSDPVNLSKSGSASNPSMFFNGTAWNVVWYDDFTGPHFTSFQEGADWAPPLSIAFPFGDNLPTLMQGLDGLSTAFWIDARGILFSSRVRANKFNDRNAWEPRQQISMATVAFTIKMDESGIFHLIYLINSEAASRPAGIYYRRSIQGGGGWTSENLLYSSGYFRGIEAAQTNLKLAIIPGEGTSTVLVGWDDLALQKVFLRRSNDGGNNWDDRIEVDYPDSNLGSAAPFGLSVATWNNQVILVWNKRSAEKSCTVFYQVSTSSGGWSAPQKLLEDFTGCSTASDFVVQSKDLLLYYTQINNQVIFAAWNGHQWSSPQVQNDLMSFRDPETGRSLTMGCLQMHYRSDQNRLYAIGCDLEGNKDIWSTSISLNQVESWFAKESVWTAPQTLSSFAGSVSSLNLISGEGDSFYSMWIQPAPDADEVASGNSPRVMMYSTWDGERWSEPTAALRPSKASPHEMDVTINSGGDLLVVWRGEDKGQIYFSRANAKRASSSLEWAEVNALPAPDSPCVSPTVLAGEGQEVYVAYAVPANEGRGIYLNYSSDEGRTWSKPVQIFDAQSAGWELVGKPILRRSIDGQVHALWQQGSLMLDGDGVGWGYAHSADGGSTWTQEEMSNEGRLRWFDLATTQKGELFRTKLEIADGVPVIVSQTSADGGITWQPPISITISGEFLGYPSMAVDATDGIHLLQMKRNITGGVFLSHWVWSNGSWAAGKDVDIEQETIQVNGMISSRISSQDKFSIMYAGEDSVTKKQVLQVLMGTVEQSSTALEATKATAQVEEPAKAATVTPIPSPTTTNSPTPQITPSETPIPTLPPQLNDGDAPKVTSEDNWSGAIMGSILAGLIVVIVFGFRIFHTRKRDYR